MLKTLAYYILIFAIPIWGLIILNDYLSITLNEPRSNLIYLILIALLLLPAICIGYPLLALMSTRIYNTTLALEKKQQSKSAKKVSRSDVLLERRF